MKLIRSFLDAAWRLAAFIGIVAALTALIQRAVPGQDDAIVFLIREALGFVALLVAAWIMGKIEGRTMADYGLPWRSMFRARFWQGILVGFAAGTTLVGAMWACGVFSFGSLALHGLDVAKWGGAWALAFVLVGLYEEFAVRGYPLATLARGIGFWPAALCSAVFFGWWHHSNTGEDWIGLFNAAFFGLFQCFLLRRTGSLWFPIGLHAAFDWSETYFYGVADSGQKLPGHLFESTTQGAPWLSGGTVGPEGSVLATALVAALWLVVSSIKDEPSGTGPALHSTHAKLPVVGSAAAGPGSSPVENSVEL